MARSTEVHPVAPAVPPSDFAEEAALVLRAQRSDAAAFRLLVERYDRRLLYFVRRIVDEPEDAYDVVQNAWLCVHQNLRKLQTPAAFRVWLYRIVHGQAMNAQRKRRPVQAAEADLAEVVDDNEPEIRFESAEAVHQGMLALSPEHRQVLTLRFLEDLSVEEIAAILGCPAGTVKSRLHYGKAALRHILEESDNG